MSDPLWSVTNVTDTQIFVPGQGAVSGKKVTFKTGTGATSSIDVPDSEFDPDNIGNMVHDAATKIIQVQALRGPDMGIADGGIVLDPAMYPNG